MLRLGTRPYPEEEVASEAERVDLDRDEHRPGERDRSRDQRRRLEGDDDVGVEVSREQRDGLAGVGADFIEPGPILIGRLEAERAPDAGEVEAFAVA